VLAWHLDPPRRSCASTVVGGGIGVRHWVLNAQVDGDAHDADPVLRLAELAAALGCHGEGVGFLTAAPVTAWTSGRSGDVAAIATVGLSHPTWAAAGDERSAAVAGTINVVAFVATRLSPAALVNGTMTATEAKTQALLEHGVAGTGTPTDAACVLTPTTGPADPYGGPRSRLGADLARAVHDAVAAGAARASERRR
jgi:adenosylcobinamide amidohydrolase